MASRNTVCFPRWGTQDVTKKGDPDFQKELDKWYSEEECKALEELVELKSQLRTTSSEDFWTVAVEGLARVVGSEMSFVMKRVLVDDQNTAVEMPPLGEPGSCLMAAAIHYRTSDGARHTLKQSKFHAYACPCAYMRHDKIFLIPEDLLGFITNNPNTLPIKVEAYMALPLFAEDKCIAHFGVMWAEESSPKHRFRYAFVETLMHSLEDMFQQRIVDGANFLQPQMDVQPEAQKVIPHEVVSVAQSLRPYAGSLSHELRTPMQGVVGMLDVMYATVQEAVQSQDDPYLRRVFQNLKESIEVVQDSSRRAVVAADNVVHAYDMNMSVPESLSPFQDAPETAEVCERQPGIVVEGQEIPIARSALKRRREEQHAESSAPNKQAKLEAVAAAWSERSEASQEIKAGLKEAENVHAEDRDLRQATKHTHTQRSPDAHARQSPSMPPASVLRRAANIRAVLQYVINEGLKTGGRPDMVTATPTVDGETIEVRSRGSDGTMSQKRIQWSVDRSIPKTMNFEEKDFSKLVSCLVLNAIKFTDGADGRIDVRAHLNSRGTQLVISIVDNGPGIPADFLPKLFKPFSQENGSLTRQSDGLGLGLMVAKGVSRKMGGDILCTRTTTDAKAHGCEFEIRLPVNQGDALSRSSSPCGSPIAQRRDETDLFSPEVSRMSPPRSTARSLQRTASDVMRQDIVSNIEQINSMPNDQTACELPKRPSLTKLHPSNASLHSITSFEIDRELAKKYPLQFLVAEDNKINRKLLVSMLAKLGYRNVLEAHDGIEAVRQMYLQASTNGRVDVVLMDLWMPAMDGYEATKRILAMRLPGGRVPTVLAVTADVTDGALEKAAEVGMKGFMSKPYKLQDLQRLITEYCSSDVDDVLGVDGAMPAALPQAAIAV